MTLRLEARLFSDTSANVGEAPVRDTNIRSYFFLDIVESSVQVLTASGDLVGSFPAPSHVGAALPAVRGGWLLALREGRATMDCVGQINTFLTPTHKTQNVRLNEAKCDPAGTRARARFASSIAPHKRLPPSNMTLTPGRYPSILSSTIHASDTADVHINQLLPILEMMSGRIALQRLADGTERELRCKPWRRCPASTAPLHTSVSPYAKARFLRPISYQGFPDSQLPNELKNLSLILLRKDGTLL